MPDRFDKFTERARRSLTYAQEEAQRFNHNYIGTEHILLGLLRESEGVAARVLVGLGADLTSVRGAVEHTIGRGERAISGDIGLTPRAKKVIELAVEEARRLNHSYIGTEHMLIGLLREGQGIAFGVLESLGITLEAVRTETAAVLSRGSPGPQGSQLRATISTLSVAQSIELRDQASDAVHDAITAVKSSTNAGLERDLMWALLMPRLTGLIEDLDAQASGAAEREGARRRLWDGIRIVATAAGVFHRHGNTALADALDAAAEAVTRAVTPSANDPSV